MSFKQRLSCLIILSLLGSVAALAENMPPLKPAKKVEIGKFLGKWYEIAYTPNIFEKQCIGNTTDEYSLLSPTLVKVINRCETNKKPFVAEGRSKILDATGAKQRTTFLKLFRWIYLPVGDYWVTALDPNYNHFIVAQPSRRYGWILARTPALQPETLKELSQSLKKQGYNPCLFMTTPQTGGFKAKQPLCNVTDDTVPKSLPKM
jgi:apolipoprotein D and lipocalin family protein